MDYCDNNVGINKNKGQSISMYDIWLLPAPHLTLIAWEPINLWVYSVQKNFFDISFQHTTEYVPVTTRTYEFIIDIYNRL